MAEAFVPLENTAQQRFSRNKKNFSKYFYGILSIHIEFLHLRSDIDLLYSVIQ